LTSKLGLKLIDDDIVNLEIASINPIKIKVHIEPHEVGKLDRDLVVALSAKEMTEDTSLEKKVTFPNWTIGSALWSGHGFFPIRWRLDAPRGTDGSGSVAVRM
jgi:hypothetical protein